MVVAASIRCDANAAGNRGTRGKATRARTPAVTTRQNATLMCGRFALYTEPARIARYFKAGLPETEEAVHQPSWNVAPTDEVYAVAERRTDDGPVRQLGTFRWGLVPSWSKDAAGAAKLINARAETLADKPAFRTALVRRRCLIPADAFYEWRRTANGRQPFAIARKDGAPMAFAGLWEVWHDPENPDSDPLRSCVIITTEANEALHRLVERCQMQGIERRIDNQNCNEKDQRQRHEKGRGRFPLHCDPQTGALAYASSAGNAVRLWNLDK